MLLNKTLPAEQKSKPPIKTTDLRLRGDVFLGLQNGNQDLPMPLDLQHLDPCIDYLTDDQLDMISKASEEIRRIGTCRRHLAAGVLSIMQKTSVFPLPKGLKNPNGTLVTPEDFREGAFTREFDDPNEHLLPGPPPTFTLLR